MTWSNGSVQLYQHMDWVGSDRFGHYIDGRIVAYDHPYAPYGESYAYEGGGLTQGYMFAGIPSDIYQPRALGLFEAPNRELSQVQGRWLSPDPAGASWNAYAYSTNPNSFTDPTGLGPGGYGGDIGLKCGSDALTGCLQNLCEAQQDQCVIDGGGDVPCSLMGSSESRSQCPNNACQSINQFLLPTQFVATMQGDFYTPLMPGEWATARQALIVAGLSTDPQSIATNTELIGNIFKSPDGKFSWTSPVEGNAINSEISVDAIPDGTRWEGTYHTHGAYDPGTFNEQFSQVGCNGSASNPCDIGSAMSVYMSFRPPRGLFGVATPSGRVQIFHPSTWTLCVAVGSAVPAGPGSSTVPIGQCP